MKNNYNKIYRILNKKQKLYLLVLFFLTIINVFFEVFSLSLVIPVMQSIFGDEPVPDFILRNKELSNMLCHAVCCDSYFSKQDFDADMELRERMLEKFDV